MKKQLQYMRARLRTRVMVGAIVFLTAVSANADEVTTMMDEAKAAYTQDNFALSLQRLQQAMNIVRELQNETLSALFPAALKGWSAMSPKDKDENLLGKAMDLGLATGVAKRYEKEQQFVQLALINNPPPILEMTLTTMQSMASANAGHEVIELGPFPGTLYCSDKTTCHLIMPLNTGFYLMGYCSIDAKTELKTYARAFDYKKLEKL